MENAPRAGQPVLLVGGLDEGLSEDKTLVKLGREVDILGLDKAAFGAC